MVCNQVSRKLLHPVAQLFCLCYGVLMVKKYNMGINARRYSGMRFEEKIVELRKQKGLSQEELAE